MPNKKLQFLLKWKNVEMKVRENDCFTKITCSHATNESPQSLTSTSQHLEEETKADDENMDKRQKRLVWNFPASTLSHKYTGV